MVKRLLDETPDVGGLQEILLRLDTASSACISADPADIAAAESYLKLVAETGRTVLPWPVVRGLFKRRICQAFDDVLLGGASGQQAAGPKVVDMEDLSDKMPAQETTFSSLEMGTEERRVVKSSVRKEVLAKFAYLTEEVAKLAETLISMDGAPFTIQRIAELLVEPSKHYRRADKYYRAIEKNLAVVTTVNPEGNRPIEVRSTSSLAQSVECAPEPKRGRVASDASGTLHNGLDAEKPATVEEDLLEPTNEKMDMDTAPAIADGGCRSPPSSTECVAVADASAAGADVRTASSAVTSSAAPGSSDSAATDDGAGSWDVTSSVDDGDDAVMTSPEPESQIVAMTSEEALVTSSEVGGEVTTTPSLVPAQLIEKVDESVEMEATMATKTEQDSSA